MPGHDIIVIGASAGGVEALKHLVSKLPPALAAAVFVVVHIPSTSVSVLPELLDRWGPLPAMPALDSAAIVPGHIYVAPTDYHLLLEPDRMRLLRGPRENHTRPAIDPLFRTAAQALGKRVVAVVLSGMLNDGTAGLIEVKRHGGIAIVQSPEDALFGDMPRSALNHVSVDYVLPVAQIASTLTQLTLDPPAQKEEFVISNSVPDAAGEMPVETITHTPAPLSDVPDPDAQIKDERDAMPRIYSCPDCGGALWQMNHEIALCNQPPITNRQPPTLESIFESLSYQRRI